MAKESRKKIEDEIKRIDVAIKKHTNLARWGNVESKERLKVLKQNKRDMVLMLREN